MNKFADLIDEHLEELAHWKHLTWEKFIVLKPNVDIPSISRSGIPNGVLNVVTGFGDTAGAAVASHMDIDCVSFTGQLKSGD
ncbi:putative aldehyde dehydrogenase (NAD(+)) [Helianthus annuus]|nr:putative aldehyde dehydrogenase (NAD(+)) [Helianthus annuus]